jgi:hypothetical protein
MTCSVGCDLDEPRRRSRRLEVGDGEAEKTGAGEEELRNHRDLLVESSTRARPSGPAADDRRADHRSVVSRAPAAPAVGPCRATWTTKMGAAYTRSRKGRVLAGCETHAKEHGPGRLNNTAGIR